VRWPNGLFDETMRIEHWSNAAEQGALAARNLATEAGLVDDEPQEYAAVPFFWSDQYDHRIQFLGRAGGVGDGAADQVVRVVIGSVDERSFVALYGSAGRLRGVLGLNRPRQTMPYRKLLEDRVGFDDALTFAAEQVVAEAAAAAQRAEQAEQAEQQQQQQ
jgi:NADPH-dependent 2,4-dienoyl-CoA reductase/sulfur reductase-like enzyme